MTKAEFIEALARELRLTKKATAELVESALALVAVAVMKHGRFSYPGFGVFRVRTRKARLVRNPKTHEPMRLEAGRTISFRPAKELKEEL
jgi:DNA-binding protein HU-beta